MPETVEDLTMPEFSRLAEAHAAREERSLKFHAALRGVEL